MKKILLISLICLGVGAVPGFHYWKKNVEKREHSYLLDRIRTALVDDKTEEAINVSAYYGLFASDERRIPDDLRSMIWESAIAKRSPILLQKLAVEDPAYLKVSERAAVEWARILVYLKRPQFSSEIIDHWRSKDDHNEAAWMQLLAEQEIINKRKEEAIQILESIESPNSQTYQWLAVLNSKNHSKAFDYLLEAYEQDMENPDTRLFLANLHEVNGSVGKSRQFYVSAVTLSNGNPIYRNALSDFYMRHGNHSMAIDALCRASKELPGVLWLKAAFWSEVTGRGPEVIPLPLDPLALKYKEGMDKSREQLPLATGSEYFKWIYLINCMSENEFKKAYHCLLSLPESSRSIAADLNRKLKSILHKQNPETPVLTRLDLAVAFLEQGWLKAGIDLCPEGIGRTSLSDELRFKFAKSYQRLGSHAQASSWLKDVEIKPELRMLSAELDFYIDEAPRGWKKLLALSGEAHAQGNKARELIGLLREQKHL